MRLKPEPTRWHNFPLLKYIADAVSYRIPLLVTEIVEYSVDGYHPICPRCHIPLEREYMSFCDRCGQRLNWSVVDLASVRIGRQ